jgi:hypothetical protein
MPRWTAAQLLSRIALEKPLKLTDWPDDMSGQILPAQLKLHEAVVQQRITDVRGRLGPPGSKERIEELLRDSEFRLLVTPYGTLTIHPPHKRLKFIEKYGIDPDNWWREIDFDQDEAEQAFPASRAPCQVQPDRPHLRLVSGTRSGEAEVLGSEPVVCEEPPFEQLTYAQIADRWGCSMEAARHRVARRNLPRTRGRDGKTLVAVSPQELVHQSPARSPDGERLVNARSLSGDRPIAELKVASPTPPPAIPLDEPAADAASASASATDVGDRAKAETAAVEAAASPPKTRRSTLPKKRRGTRGPAPEKTDLVASRIRNDIRAKHFTMLGWRSTRAGRALWEGRLFEGSRRVPQKQLTERYDCSSSTLLDALNIVWSELRRNSERKTPSEKLRVTPSNSDKK